jgi:hypothetical protein
MRIAADRVRKLCARRGESLQGALAAAGVSRTAYYSLVRRTSILPGTVHALAAALGVAPGAILEETPPVQIAAQRRLRVARRVVARNPGCSFENVWHTLVLLEEPPLQRLRRSLLRGRAGDLH